MPAHLSASSLGDLLGRLHRAGANGALEITRLGLQHRILFASGLIAGLEVHGNVPRLGEVLLAEGFVTTRDVDAMVQAQRLLGEHSPPCGELLIRQGALRPETRDIGLRAQARRKLEHLFGLVEAKNTPGGPERKVTVRFLVGPAIRFITRLLSPMAPSEFLFGRRRARDGVSPTPPKAASLRERAAAKLGLPVDSDQTTIRRAFRVAAAKVHPDRFPHESAQARHRLSLELAELSAAYHLLTS